MQQTVATSAMRIMGKVPARLKDVPELHWGLGLYYDSYFDLTTERSHAMGFTMIPWHSIAQYALFHDFDADQTDRLFHHIRSMDNAHITKLAADAEAKRAK
jgi:hypothetical protein